MNLRQAVTSISSMSLLFIRSSVAFADDVSVNRSQNFKKNGSGSKTPLHRSSYIEAYEAAAPAVVNIQCSAASHFPFVRGVSSGSGFIISDSGRVVTNCHVVQNCQTAPVITLGDNQQFRASVVGVDKATDLALLQIVTPEGLKEQFPVAKLGDSDQVKPGTLVMALGSPLLLQKTATHGIISAIERHSGELGLSASHRTDYIQTDAPINIGNSGGPLIDLDGAVIGVTTMKAENAPGISFSIPIKTGVVAAVNWQFGKLNVIWIVKAVVEQLNQYGQVTRPYIGIFMLTLTPTIIQRERQADPNFPEVKSGVLVTSVSPLSPAASAGIRPGDIIIAVDADIHINSAQALTDYLGFDYKRSIILHVLRGRNQKLKIRIDPVLRDTRF